MPGPRELLDRVAARLPAEVRRQVAESVRRLTAVRSARELAEAVPEEMERLVASSVPVLAQRPLPVTSPVQARALAAAAAGGAATLQQLGELSLLETMGVSGAALTPAVLAGLFSASVVEVWLAVTIRTSRLRAAGREVDEGVLGAEIAEVILGGSDTSGPRRLARAAGRHVAGRMGKRWAAGLVPVLGIAYDGWDAQRTINRVMALPVSAHPPGS